MKARIENEEIKLYGTLPNDFENILNFRNAEEEIIRSKGFYDVITPAYDSATQRLGELYFDDNNHVFTYHVIEMTLNESLSVVESANNRARRELKEALIELIIDLHRGDLPGELLEAWDKLVQRKPLGVE